MHPEGAGAGNTGAMISREALASRLERGKYSLDRVLRRVGFDPTVIRQGRGFDDADEETIRFVGPETMATAERVAAVCQAVRYLSRHGIEGAVVECGVWRGGMMMAAARTLLEAGDVRPLYLYDTFTGMTEPSAADVDAKGRTAATGMRRYGLDDSGNSLWCNASVDIVRANLARTGYPMDQVHLVEGPVEETLPATLPGPVALLRLDTDWYESTAHELRHLFPLLVGHGVLVIDDYGHWKGSRRAVDEYLAGVDVPVLLNRTDYTGRVAVIPPRPQGPGGR